LEKAKGINEQIYTFAQIMKLDRNQILGFIYVLISAICFSSKGVIIKLAYGDKIDAISLLAFRMLFSFPFFLVALFYKPKGIKIEASQKDLGLVIILGLLGYYFSSLLDFYGLEYVSAGLERLILFIYPTMVVLLAAIFMKKPITKAMIWSLVITYAGILMVVAYDISTKGSGLLIGISYIFFCAFTFAIYLVLSDDLVHKFGTIRYTAIIMLSSATGVFIQFLIQKDIASLFT
jgi:drug/metabolite transporter (DMT)-like permease